ALFRVVRACWITGSRAYPAIFFVDELAVGQGFAGLVAPELLAHPEVEVFGECFREPIGQRFENDAAVVVVICFEALYVLIDADSRRYRERADVIVDAAAGGCDEIGEAIL